MDNLKKKNSLDEKEKSWIFLSIAFGFMLCVFAPLETFFTNESEFWFGLIQLIPVLLIVFVAFSIILYALSILAKKSKAAMYIYTFAFTLLLFFYIQGNYIPRNYGVLNGADIDWNSYTSYGVASIVLAVILLILWLFAVLKLKNKVYRVGRFVCTVLVLLQIVTTGILYVQNNVMTKSDSTDVIVTDNKIFDLSDKGNIIIFILDSFDSSVLRDMLDGNDGKKYEEIFTDFTYYPDTLGAYPTTKGSLPFILTGKWYENDKTYAEYVKDAYVDNEIYTALEDNDFSIGVYTSSQYVNPDSEMYTNIEEGTYVISDYSSFTKKLYDLVAFNYMPHQLKKYFYTSTEDFEDLKTSKKLKTSKYGTYSMDDQTFYRNLSNEGLSTNDDGKSFRLYHVEGVHQPYTFDENLNSDENESYDIYDEAAGSFTLLQRYLDQLKENNIYDSSTIIVMADHGYYNMTQNPLFMIKNAGEQHDFSVSERAMSWEYLSNIFISLASGEVVDENYIYALNAEKQQRRYLHYSWDGSTARQYLPNMIEYITVGDATDTANLTATGRFYAPGDESVYYPYELGTELSFMEEDTASAYCIYGFSENEGTHTWTNGTSAAMAFRFDEDFDSLELSLDYGTFDGEQRVIIYANDNIVANYVANGSEMKSLIIPKEFIEDGNLTLRFEFPEARSPKSLDQSEDARVLALGMHKISISSSDEVFDPESQIE